MEKVRPIGDKVMLLFPQEGRYENGIYVLGESERRVDAIVVDKGPRVSDEIRVGSTVIADRISGVQVTVDGVAYRLISEKDIQADTEIRM